jgi:uncharacterized protein with NRDE domain
MCLLVLAWQCQPDYELVLAGNRDEFHDRPATPAGWWPSAPHILAGRDEVAGGTWLGVSRSGRVAVVTNYREGANAEPAPRSRGALVTDFLDSDRRPAAWCADIDGRQYAGFNLLTFGDGEACYLSNRAPSPVALRPGIHGLSNHRLDTPWPKLVRTRTAFEDHLRATVVDPAVLFSLLGDSSQADDDDLPESGVSRAWERILSAPFIVHPDYGTRASTVVIVSRDGDIYFEERRFDRSGTHTGGSVFRFSSRGGQAVQ